MFLAKNIDTHVKTVVLGFNNKYSFKLLYLFFSFQKKYLMNYTNLLNKIFWDSKLHFFIPVANYLITLLKQGKKVKTSYDKKLNKWITRENNIVLSIDSRPMWNISYERLRRIVSEICCFNYFPKENDTVFDIGAGAGTESIVFAKELEYKGKVYAFEAHPVTFSSLSRLKEINDLDNLNILNCAIGNKSKRALISDLDNHEANKVNFDWNNFNDIDSKGFLVDVISLDEFIDNKGILQIDFMKINIEGGEIEALKGLVNQIHIVKNIAISCHDFLIGPHNSEIRNWVIRFLESQNFDIITRDTGHIARDSWIYGKNKLCN